MNATLQAQTYQVVVVVTDDGTPPLSSNETVTVQVEPRNVYSPSFESTPYTFSFIENSNGSTFTFIITDDDPGGINTPGTANVTLVESIYSSSFQLYTTNSTTAVLTVVSSFDREVLSTFNLTVVAYDTGYDEFRKTSDTTIVCIVIDANDNLPTFTAKRYTTQVAENASMGHQFFQVSATDNDTDIDSLLTFSLLNFETIFSINPSTGWISVAGILERGIFPNYTLGVQVNDSVNHTDTSLVIVTIIEVNEHVPRFDPTLPTTVTIIEGNDYSLNISVTDDDLGPAGDVILSVIPSIPTYFEIQDNSRLVLVRELDYEVSVWRGGTELQSSSSLVHVSM